MTKAGTPGDEPSDSEGKGPISYPSEPCPAMPILRPASTVPGPEGLPP